MTIKLDTRPKLRILKDPLGVLFRLNAFGRGVQVRAFIESIRPKHWYIIMSEGGRAPGDKFELILFGRIYITTSDAYGEWIFTSENVNRWGFWLGQWRIEGQGWHITLIGKSGTVCRTFGK